MNSIAEQVDGWWRAACCLEKWERIDQGGSQVPSGRMLGVCDPRGSKKNKAHDCDGVLIHTFTSLLLTLRLKHGDTEQKADRPK
jgi:hypothetical protein